MGRGTTQSPGGLHARSSDPPAAARPAGSPDSSLSRESRLRRKPGPASSRALREHLDAVLGQDSGDDGEQRLGSVVDAVMGARRLASWSLWVELAAIARLVSVWKGKPPILDERLGPPPCQDADPGLAARLERVIQYLELDIRPWGAPPLDTAALAEEFVVSEIAAATGLSFTRARQRVDAATSLFLTDRLPRTAALLQAGLLDEAKLRTVLMGTADLDEATCRAVEARVISDADLDVADPLDVRADPSDLHSHPGTALPAVTRMTNPALERALRAAVLAVDAEAAARRAARARDDRHVRVTALPDGMGALTVETGQEVVTAIVNDLDACVASAKAAGDPRRPDQIRCDELVHRMTYGAFGAPTGISEAAANAAADADPGGNGCGCGTSGSGSTRWGRYGRRGMSVNLTMPLSTWLGLADEPGLLDGHEPIAGALARQIANDAARQHPTTTTWRCVVVDDQHRTVLGVGDLIPTPRHDPPPRIARLVSSTYGTCAYPGCPVSVRQCDLDHRIPHEQGGVTCSCNIQPLCRRHHRLKGTGVVKVDLVHDADEPVGTLRWSSWTGRIYLHRPPEAAVAPVRPADGVPGPAVIVESAVHPADVPLRHEWKRSVAEAVEQDERRRQHRQSHAHGGSPSPDDPPPF